MDSFANLLQWAVQHHQRGELVEAERLYRQILIADASQAQAHAYLGALLQATGREQESIGYFLQALRIDPSLADAHYNLGNALARQGQIPEAISCYKLSLQHKPNHAEALNNLGVMHYAQGKDTQATGYFQQTLRINPNHADAHYNLGNVLFGEGKFAEAAEHFRESIRVNPDRADAINNLGNVLAEQGFLDDAIKCFDRAIQRQPDYAAAYTGLGNAYKDQGRLDDAIACFKHVQNLEPQNQARASNTLLCLNYHPGYDARAIFTELRRWEQSLPQSGRSRLAFANDPSPERRLRIGYISPDFHDHIVGRNVWPLLRCHDHERFNITLYSNSPKCDAFTERFQKSADDWLSVFGWSDEQLADKVRHDKIDILVDLALHTSGNRLTVFIHKPAPVQVTFAGYPGSTGLPAIDYRLTDPYLDPPGLFDSCYSESSFRLPHSFWCYDPATDQPEVAPLPALTQGFITFGCLNNFCKINDGVLELWAQVLRAVPEARLLLLAKQGGHRQRTRAFLSEQGIEGRRIAFCDPEPPREYLKLYHQLDIGLDTLPYNGHTTSLDSLWMGVPVITLIGKTVVGRAGLSQLTNLGLAEYAAATPEAFVQNATDLASDLPRLNNMRNGLRQRVQQSPLMDAVSFARGIEDAYRIMWRTWCHKMKT
jgi:protein O-GlcNAc transferase